MHITPEGDCNEKELLRLFQKGDETAFNAIYVLYSKQLFRKILHMVNDEHTAKELLQDLFMKIWENRKHIDPAKSFKSYLYTIGVNLVYDHFRKAGRDKQLASQLLLMAVDQYTHIEEAIVNKDNMNLIRNAVNKLSPQRKKVFILCKLEGKSYEEVSQELHISTSTIHDHMVKANYAVRNYLNSHPDLVAYSLAAMIFLY
ncbi:RNA polymerase sigma factor [Mucilaginibacter dorajii]|uniref:RNA polymerase sigma-70 factor n=1 Tax=Mucilaginibacter dorajii TaxID=692994 RepID=A0ABP7Q1P9_9SPHI|nr:sigma-70 family RNA polymerase sigma factor [Mucilaginibacter dorajii]MCS3732815.1 RNA polymerase sigma-70 factor (ECF subfamily) [Mucilaginibacter dorajii]